MLSREQFEAFKREAFMLAMHIGLNPAARAMGIKESRIRKWASRDGWSLSKVRPSNGGRDAAMSQVVTPPLEAQQKIISLMSDRTRLAMGRTSMRAFEHCDTLTEDELHKLPTAIALEKHGRNATTAFQWQASQANVAVQVNVPLPSPDERAEMRRLDDKLDAIAAKLQNQ